MVWHRGVWGWHRVGLQVRWQVAAGMPSAAGREHWQRPSHRHGRGQEQRVRKVHLHITVLCCSGSLCTAQDRLHAARLMQWLNMFG